MRALKYFTDAFASMGVTFRYLFKPPVTVDFPREERPRAPRYRASFALTHDENGEERCIGCKICEHICPSDIIRVTPAGKKESPVTGKKRGYCKDFTLDLNACIICELCVQVCPTDAIVMVRSQEKPGFCREDLFLTSDKLYGNEKLKELTWAKASLLKEMQNPKRKPAKAEAGKGEEDDT